MILAEGLLIGLVGGLVTGGSIGGLRQIRLKHEAVFIGAFVTQLIAPHFLQNQGVRPMLLLYAAWILPSLLSVVVAARNSHYPGMGILAAGLALNLAVVGVNSGMPVSVQVAEELGIEASTIEVALEASWLHVSIEADTLLAFLGDVIPVPGPDWHRALISLGDVFIAGGAFLFVFAAMHDSLVEHPT